jgi:beta-phosphoglucomutase-like phosphatase (HAD superfamily)
MAPAASRDTSAVALTSCRSREHRRLRPPREVFGGLADDSDFVRDLLYRHAPGSLGARAVDCLVVEDWTTGTQSALVGGIATIGNLALVPDGEPPDPSSA